MGIQERNGQQVDPLNARLPECKTVRLKTFFQAQLTNFWVVSISDVWADLLPIFIKITHSAPHSNVFYNFCDFGASAHNKDQKFVSERIVIVIRACWIPLFQLAVSPRIPLSIPIPRWKRGVAVVVAFHIHLHRVTQLSTTEQPSANQLQKPTRQEMAQKIVTGTFFTHYSDV